MAKKLETSDIDYKKTGVGVALDVGTTTIAGACMDLSTGEVLAEGSCGNPQARWGRDVVSRLEAVVRDGLLQELSTALAGACADMVRRLAGGRAVTGITAAGNPVMEHLLLGISPEGLSRVPYRPAFKKAQRLAAFEAGLYEGKETGLYAFPLIGGFVGGDAVAAALFLGLHREKEPALAIDIGTNSEIMLASHNGLYATSAAAGPAFEGGEVSSGMVAGPGAIEGVAIDGDTIRLSVIGNAAPRGICGSGLIEAASRLLRAGVIEPSGRIKGRDEVDNNLSNRIREDAGGNAFVLYRGASGVVALTQADIRALQTAKAATRAGVEVLLKKAGLEGREIRKVYIAGAFGSHLTPEGLSAIGVIDGDWERPVSVGDAALKGALMALSDEKKAEAEELAERFRYVPLSGNSHFEAEFIRRMDFPRG